MKVDLNKKYQSRQGDPARVYVIDGGGLHPVHGSIWLDDEKQWLAMTWTSHGRYHNDDLEDGWDLVEAEN
jgi:hypothetical protein